MPRYELDGQVAIVTGAGRGIGRAIALRLAREEASVVVTDTVVNPSRARIVAIGGPGREFEVKGIYFDIMKKH